MAQQRKFVVMGFGPRGNHGKGIDSSGRMFSSDWFIRPELFQELIDSGHYPPEEMEGCLLINQVPVITKDPSAAIESPMVDCSLSGQEVSRMADLLGDSPDLLGAIMLGDSNRMAAALAGKAIADKGFIGLDAVSPAVYAKWWQERGAVIGTVHDGKVMWQTGT